MDISIKRILVPVDLGDYSFSALKHAAALAEKNGAVIHILHVISNSSLGLMIPPEVYFAIPFASKEIILQQQDALEKWKTLIRLSYDVQVRTEIREGNPARQINKYAEENNIDFIILGMHENRTWLDKLIGSTAKYIARSSKKPVITILHSPEGVFHWQNVVLPVSTFVPEKRIKAILNFAMLNTIKIHFVAIAGNIEEEKSEKFHLLLDSLKLVKTFGNIPVECKSLGGGNLLKAAWTYATGINADAIMINSGNESLPKDRVLHAHSPSWYEALFVKTFTN